MVSRVVGFYRNLYRSVLNGYRYGIWRTSSNFSREIEAIIQNANTQAIAGDKSTPGKREQNAITLSEPSLTSVPYKGRSGLSRPDGELSTGVGGLMKAMNPNESIHRMGSLSEAFKELGTPLQWQREAQLNRSLWEANTMADMYGKGMKKFVFPHLPPETIRIINQRSTELYAPEYIYLCRYTGSAVNGRQWFKYGRSKDVADRMRRHKKCNLELIVEIRVHDMVLVEKLIESSLKRISHVIHGLDKCPSCGTGHREMFSVAAGKDGEELIKVVIDECVLLDELCFRSRQVFF